MSLRCAGCHVPLEDALILVCDNNLCLSCAARGSGGGDEHIVFTVAGETFVGVYFGYRAFVWV